MSKITLNQLANLQNDQTATALINANSTTVQTAFDNTLSRDGTTPNTMLSPLDMNSNQIYNLPPPASATAAARLQDIGSLPTINLGFPSLIGDVTAPSNNGALTTTVNKVHGVTYPASPTVGTFPVVTATNTVSYNYKPFVDIRDYGAVTGGSVDCTTAIQTAVDAAGAMNGICYFPPGRWKITSSITISAPCHLLGAARNWSVNDYTGTNIDPQSMTASDCFKIEADDVSVEGINIQAPGARNAVSQGAGWSVGKSGTTRYGTVFRDCSTVSNSIGYHFKNASNFIMDNCRAHDFYGVQIENSNADEGAGNLINCTFSSSASSSPPYTQFAVNYLANGDLRLVNNKFLNAGTSFNMDWTGAPGGSGDLEFSNCSFENFADYAIDAKTNQVFTGLKITGCRFGEGSSATKVLRFSNAGGSAVIDDLLIVGNIFHMTNGSSNIIEVGRVNPGYISGNIFTGSTTNTAIFINTNADRIKIGDNYYRNISTNINDTGANTIKPTGTLQTPVYANAPALTGNATAANLAATGALTAYSGTAPPATTVNSKIGVGFTSTANLGLWTGTGDPNGNLSAAKGSLFVKTDATTTTTRLYVNTDGGTTWANFTASA